MTYNEADHPRDRLGRWTEKGGGGNNYETPTEGVFKLGAQINDFQNKTPAQILYKGSIGKEQNEKNEKEYKGVLINVLGGLATTADILYADNKKLEKKIKENGLANKLKGHIEKHQNPDYRKAQINPKNGDFGFNKSKNNLIYYKKLSKDYENELGDFLRKNTNNPNYYSNDLRHQFVSAIFTRNLGEKATKIYGDLNEITGGLSAPGDSDIDQINNEIGRNYAKNYPNMPREELLKLMLKEHSKNQQIRIEKMKEKNKNNLDREYM